MDKFGHFGQFLAFFRESKNLKKKFGFVSFEYLWSLNFMQNIKKNNEPVLRKMLW